MLRPLDYARSEVEKARGAGLLPRVHGNGFLQLDLLDSGSEQRLHIWGHPALPRQSVSTAIHDHRFGFRSRVLRGRLIQADYRVVQDRSGDGSGRPDDCTHCVYRAHLRHGQDTELRPSGVRVWCGVEHVRFVHPGEVYWMAPMEFHETFSEQPTATLMRKTQVEPGHSPRVLVPIGLEPDNEFDRHAHDADALWAIIEEVLHG